VLEASWRPTVGSVVRVWPHPPHPYHCTCRTDKCLNAKVGTIVQVTTWHLAPNYYVVARDHTWAANFHEDELQDVVG
jgi:hypothetical protein